MKNNSPSESDLVYRLRKRAEIRKQIPTRRSVINGEIDRLAALLEEAADDIERLRKECTKEEEPNKLKVVKSLNGARASLLRSIDHQSFIRIHNRDGSYEDLTILTYDLTFIIDDEDAYAYKDSKGELFIDQSPSTLGLSYE